MKPENPYYKFSLSGNQRAIIINLMAHSWRICVGANIIEIKGAFATESKVDRAAQVVRELLTKLRAEPKLASTFIQILLPDEPIQCARVETALKSLLSGDFKDLKEATLVCCRPMFS